VKSRDNSPFDISVVDQDTLDNNSELKYRNVTNGSISGQLKQDKNVYQNHFLILKADSPCECDVEIEKTELDVTSVQGQTMQGQTLQGQSLQGQSLQGQSLQGQSLQSQTMAHNSSMNHSKFNEDKNDGFHWIKIVLGLGLMVGVGFAVYWVSRKYEKAVLYTPPRILSSPKITNNNNSKNNLLDRLKGLEIDAI
jgi:hypothetical protein